MSKRKNNNPSYLLLSQQPNRESTIGKLTCLAQPKNQSFTFHSDFLRKKKKSKCVKHYFLTKQNLNKENRKTNRERERYKERNLWFRALGRGEVR